MSRLADASDGCNADPRVDQREQLFNCGEIGPIQHIQRSADEIVSLRAIMLDIDCKLFRPEVLPRGAVENPELLYAEFVKPILERHVVLRCAEVRMSGTGLHVLLHFDEPVRFESVGEREKWEGIYRVIQASLPTDPDAPSITATTRAIGSINGKNGAEVKQLKAPTSILAERVKEFSDELRSAPFRKVADILFGSDNLQPCPLCNKGRSKLRADDHVGHCYGNCGTVRVARLYDHFLLPREAVSVACSGGA